MRILTEEEYEEAKAMKRGWCRVCQAFTRIEVSPEGENYFCPACQEHDVMGVERAWLNFQIDVE